MADRDSINRVSEGRVPSVGAASPANISLLPVVATTTQLGAVTDTAGFHSVNLKAEIGVYGTVASATVFIEAEVQESAASGSGFTAVADADLIFPPGDAVRAGTATGTFFCSKSTTNADLSGVYTCGYRGTKRYLKINLRFTGTHTTGSPVATSIICGFPDYQPVAGNAT